MTVDLATAYVKTGLTKSPANDALLNNAVVTALAVSERFLDREIIFGQKTEEFYYTHHRNYYLTRYPIDQIISMDGGGGQGYHVHNRLGKIVFAGYRAFDKFQVTYTGGYRVFPPDLEAAIWTIFSDALALGQGGSTVSAGEISSISIPDVGTIKYNVANLALAAGKGGDGGLISDVASALLRPYKRPWC